MPVTIPPDSTVVVVSDMHIGDGSPTEPFARKDALFRRFLDFVRERADVLVLAGDGFDLAQAWSMERIRRSHGPLLRDLADLASEIPVHYVQGNHDGTPEDLSGVLPFRFSPAVEIGDEVHVEHGNRFDPRNLPGDRRAFWGARAHAYIEKAIRSPVRIPMRKHYYWSTRLGHWVFFHYGRLRRLEGSLRQALGEQDGARRSAEFLDYWGGGEWGDIHAMLPGVSAFLEGSPTRTLVCGHAHQAGELRFPDGTYVNTGSWTYGDSTYVLYDHGEIGAYRFPDHQRIEDDEYRGVLGPHRGKSFFDWWDAHYLGWLRYDVDAMWQRAGGED